AGDGAWRAAVCERALLDKNVARVLSSVEAEATDARSPNVSNAWQRSRLLGDSAYGSLVDDFLRERQYWTQRMIDFLGLMTKIKVPSRRVLAMPRPYSLLFPFSIALTGGLGIYLASLVSSALGTSTTSADRTAGFIAKFSPFLVGFTSI